MTENPGKPTAMNSELAKRVLILNSPEFFRDFHETLVHLVKLAGAEVEIAETWLGGVQAIQQSTEPFDLLILDPHLSHFDTRLLLQVIAGKNYALHPKIIGIQYLPEYDEDSTLEELHPDALIARSFDIDEIAFSIHRFLLPERESIRKHPRVEFGGSAETLSTESELLAGSQKVLNVSAEGLFIETDQPLPRLQRIRLRITHPDFDRPIVCEGIVRHNRSPRRGTSRDCPVGMGIQIDSISEGDREALKKLIEKQLNFGGGGPPAKQGSKPS